MRHFLFVLRNNGCYYPNKIATFRLRGTELSSAQASVLFRYVAISGGISVTYFLNALKKYKSLLSDKSVKLLRKS